MNGNRVYSSDDWESIRKATSRSGKTTKDLLGGKGAGMVEMTHLGIPVPPGIILTTEACRDYLEAGNRLEDAVWSEVSAGLDGLQKTTGKTLGDPERPLLISCRSGARDSMPGMMDTVLNLGLNDVTVERLAQNSGNPCFAFDAYRRLIQMFGSVVMGIADEPFEAVLARAREEAGVDTDTGLSEESWREVTREFKRIYRKNTGEHFPEEPIMQIRKSIEAVFESWNGKRAIDYRNATGIPHDLGTAVNLVTMIFGNLGLHSATGVVFTRDPVDGTNRLYGDYLINAQGEDVVAGIRNTRPIAGFADDFPDLYPQLEDICARLEKYYRDMQDVEFTIEEGKLWMLQTRSGKRTAQAAVKIAVDQVGERLISKKDALLRVSPAQVDSLMHPRFDEAAKQKAIAANRCLAHAVGASPGAAVGIVAFDADTAERWGKEGKSVIMVRPFTRPDDVHGMLASKGILTAEGGATSHAAVVARQFGVPCIVGAAGLRIATDTRSMQVDGRTINEGDFMSIDGSRGDAFAGTIETVSTDLSQQHDLMELLGWADQYRRLRIRANADYPEDADKARQLGAEGIGLCRTEHMFFHPDRLPVVQNMILTDDEDERDNCLAELKNFQKDDFIGLFRAMDGLPLIIRLIDPPLHEFAPERATVVNELAEAQKSGEERAIKEKQAVLAAIDALHESNPMMGLRGVRLSIVHPHIVEMQVRAIFEAACQVRKEGLEVLPEVMVPLVGHVNELKVIRKELENLAREVMAAKAVQIDYEIGTMIELPRACVTADEIAEIADFFSFGTNDLTQMTYGFSRDDAEAGFLLHYLEHEILPANPFKTIDEAGVGSLIETAVGLGRGVKPDLSIGICGEHGGDPASIHFCERAGLDYVSCSPYRIPVARLAAAQARLAPGPRAGESRGSRPMLDSSPASPVKMPA